jgi:signal-transduction protein with cAMP-binding, CBS, and nucleotidyltransferase domain
MNNEMPWVNITQEEVEELRNKKHELTEYGKQKLRKMMNDNPTIDEMIEEAARRERSNRILERYNNFYNIECSGLSHGTAITPEFQQAMTLECMLDALRCENLNREYNEIAIVDINDLIERLYQQGKDYLNKVQEFKDSADGVA